MKPKKSFLGTGWSFPPRFDDELEDLTMVSDEQDIYESLYLLMSTTPGERPTNPAYGCDLRRFNFKPINDDEKYFMEETIKDAILWFEPRVKCEEVEIDTTSELEGVVYITVHYFIHKVNRRMNIVYPFYKIEGTEVSEV